jgi:3-dehydroquinate synthase
VAAHYLEPALVSLREAGLQAATLVIKPGEASKTLREAARLYDGFLAAGLDRGSVVVALGGGVVTDLAGFAAATYLRGIAWVAVPTTLLAQVDAAVGGKTGVDLKEGKNLVGAFHQPAAVLADVATLATLPDEELRTGLAEVVKHAVIRDAALAAMLEAQADRILARDAPVLEALVARNVRIKAAVVMADEREADLRRILNYGHTIGHALEALALRSPADFPGPARQGDAAASPALTHGRAVSLGMMAEAAIALRRGLIGQAVLERQRRLLDRFGLPVRLASPPDAKACLAILAHDKKAEAGRRCFVLPEAIGQVRVVDDVTDDEIRDALTSLVS